MPSARVRPITPCFATGYGKQPGMILKPCVDAMFTMLPAPRSTMPGSTARQPFQTPSRSTAKQRRQSSSVIVSGSQNTLMPALFTSTSTRAERRFRPRTACCTEALCVTSVCTASTLCEPVAPRDTRGRRARGLDIEFRQHDRRAFARERERNRRADAATRAGDQSRLCRQAASFLLAPRDRADR